MFEHRLLLLTEVFPPSVGGIQAYLHGLFGALPAEHAFVVAASQSGDRAWDRGQPYRTVRVPMQSWTFPRWKKAWQAARHLIQREKIEAVVCGKALFEGRAARKLQEEFHVPYVVCTYAMEISRWLEREKTRRDLLEVLRSAGRVVVINEGTKRLLRTLNVPERKLVKIYPGVAEEFFSAPSGVDEFRTLHRLVGKRVVVSVARLVPRKGIDVLLESMGKVLRSVPDAHLLIVGGGPEHGRLSRMVRERGLQRVITFLGEASVDDVSRALACADIFALTPRNLEGFGIVYLEAAATGKTSIGSRTGGVTEAVLDGVTGLLVPPDDADAAARALVRVLEDENLRTRLAKAARTRAEKEFHWPGRTFLFQGMVHAMLTE